MPKYMLLLHDNPAAFANVSPNDMQKVVEKYIAWGKKLREAGVMKAGDKLTDEPGKLMRRKNNQVRVTDGPYSESKELLGGYCMIRSRQLRTGHRLRPRLPATRLRRNDRSPTSGRDVTSVPPGTAMASITTMAIM